MTLLLVLIGCLCRVLLCRVCQMLRRGEPGFTFDPNTNPLAKVRQSYSWFRVEVSGAAFDEFDTGAVVCS